MYYLTKFCRICIKTGENLLDLNSKDYDLVTLQEKLEVCTKMIVSKEDLSTLICMACVKKLRISYIFQEMCMKSNDILHGYLSEILKEKDCCQQPFVNSELRVTLSPIPQITLEEELDKWYLFLNGTEKSEVHEVPKIKTENRHSLVHHHTIKENFRTKKKRVSKGQRCSLLKKLLSTINNNTSDAKVNQTSPNITVQKQNNGGLKDLLVFIKDYEFGYKLNKFSRQIKDTTPLDKLEHFSKTFFYTDFTAYRNTILSVINENRSDSSEDEDMFNCYDEEEDTKLWKTIKQEPADDSESVAPIKIEELIIEPDLKIKQELLNENEYESEYLPSELVQACYDDENYPSSSGLSKTKEFINYDMYANKRNGFMSSMFTQTATSTMPSSLELLQQFTNRTKSCGRKTMNPMSLKCRTRGQPFINPQLMEQFKERSFKCDKCNRSFKSPGYLHSHCTKMGH